MSQRAVQNLPLNGRNYVQLAQLASGANQGTAAAITNGNRPDDRRQSFSIVVNAQSDTLNNEMIEGVDNNEGTIGSVGVRPSINAIAEFGVQTNLYPAEAGKTPGAVVRLKLRVVGPTHFTVLPLNISGMMRLMHVTSLLRSEGGT